MEILLAITLIFMLGYAVGTAITRHRIRASSPPRRCKDCRYCYEISAGTKSLMPTAYRDKKVCIMHRGSTVPVGANGSTISVVGEDAFCNQWKERDLDG